MASDPTIAALRVEHDLLSELVGPLGEEQLLAQSAASEWTVAQVLSHLGSGAQILLRTLNAALGVDGPVPEGFNQTVWDRWNSLAPAAQRDGAVEADETLVRALESLDDQTLAELSVSLAFLPFPLAVPSIAGMRLYELSLHSWDVRAPLDPAATVRPATADLLLAKLAGPLGFYLGFGGKAANAHPSTIGIADTDLSFVITESVALTREPVDRTASFSGEPEAALRLISGRLTAEHTAPEVSVTGNITLDDLRAVFPGF